MSIGALIEKFRAVGLDRIERMNLALVALERDTHDEEAAEELLREVHTLKGEAKMMGFADVNLVAHQTEHLLMRGAVASWEMPEAAVNRIFEGLDLIRALLTKQAGAQEAAIDLSTFVDAVHVSLALFDAGSLEEHSALSEVLEERSAFGEQPYLSEARAPHGERHHAMPGEALGVEEEVAAPGVVGLVEGSGATTLLQMSASPARAERQSQSASGMLRLQSENSLRVSLEKLERLSDVASEVHLMGRKMDYNLERLEELRAGLSSWTRRVRGNLPKRQAATLRELGHRFDALLGTLIEDNHLVNLRASLMDEEVRELRHIPLAQVFSHYPRAVRDLAQVQGKRVRLTLDLGNIAVDRAVLSALSDPLLHLVRNAVDHGLELPHEREALGKGVEGELSLTAELVGESLRVTLCDDGRGIDPEHVKRRAVERGLLTVGQAGALSEREATALIFEPGFSTRVEVTDVSGRGIGMDIVLRQVTALGGVVELSSEVGRGATFTLLIPLSSAVLEVLLVGLNGETFAIHARDIERVMHLRPAELVTVHGAASVRDARGFIPVCDWRPLVTAGEVGQWQNRKLLELLVIEKGSRRVAVWVDHIIGEREALNRPLGEFLQGLTLCRGVAMTGAGEVIPLLNVVELLNRDQSVRSSLGVGRAEGGRAWSSTLELRQLPRLHTILVAEDSEVTRTLVAGIVRGMGHRVLEARDGEAAWEMMQSYKIDLLITDMQMPRLGGLGLIARVRQEGSWSALPIVVLSTLGASADKEEAMRLGADAYLVKLDFREKDLVGVVRRYLS